MPPLDLSPYLEKDNQDQLIIILKIRKLKSVGGGRGGGSINSQLREDLQPTQRGSAQSVNPRGRREGREGEEGMWLIDSQLREDPSANSERIHTVLILGVGGGSIDSQLR